MLVVASLPNEVLGFCYVENCRSSISKSNETSYKNNTKEIPSSLSGHHKDCHSPVSSHRCCSHRVIANLKKQLNTIFFDKQIGVQFAYSSLCLAGPALDNLYRPPIV